MLSARLKIKPFLIKNFNRIISFRKNVSFIKFIFCFLSFPVTYTRLRSPKLSLIVILGKCGLTYITGTSKMIALTLRKTERVRKKHFIPRGRARGIGLREFLIKSGARRSVSNGNMHVRPRDFAGGMRPAPFVKRGCNSITMEFIHPSIHPAAWRWARYGAERATERNFFSSFISFRFPEPVS